MKHLSAIGLLSLYLSLGSSVVGVLVPERKFPDGLGGLKSQRARTETQTERAVRLRTRAVRPGTPLVKLNSEAKVCGAAF